MLSRKCTETLISYKPKLYINFSPENGGLHEFKVIKNVTTKVIRNLYDVTQCKPRWQSNTESPPAVERKSALAPAAYQDTHISCLYVWGRGGYSSTMAGGPPNPLVPPSWPGCRTTPEATWDQSLGYPQRTDMGPVEVHRENGNGVTPGYELTNWNWLPSASFGFGW